jgi:hypothetical protein
MQLNINDELNNNVMHVTLLVNMNDIDLYPLTEA